MNKNIAIWHKIIQRKDTKLLYEILDDTIVFHSPIMHKPQIGKNLAYLYLSSAAKVLEPYNFSYVKETYNHLQAMLEFEAEIDGF